MQDRNTIKIEATSEAYSTSYSIPLDVLSELARTTTAYYGASPDRWEDARTEYEKALRKYVQLRELTPE
jgi:hypothetical protein